MERLSTVQLQLSSVFQDGIMRALLSGQHDL